MRAAASPRADVLEHRLLHVDPAANRFGDAHVADLPRLLRAGDLLVLNDAATLPASLSGVTASGARVEVRLAARGVRGGEEPGPCPAPQPPRRSGATRSGGPERSMKTGMAWTGVLFGAGDWRMRTEDRPSPPALAVGDRLRFGADLEATIAGVTGPAGRVLDLVFDQDGAEFFSALYRLGRPVQYSYLAGPVRLDQVQTAYASRPWAFEPPSAGRPLTWPLLQALVGSGIRIAALTHAAGLSSIGDAAADAVLPLPERYDIPKVAVNAVAATRASGGRVVAVGTTVVRALEGAAASGRLHPGEGVTDLRIGPSWRPRVVDGLLTGMHDPGTSHFALLTAFAPEDLLLAAHRHAEDTGYLAHEFGDSSLVLAE